MHIKIYIYSFTDMACSFVIYWHEDFINIKLQTFSFRLQSIHFKSALKELCYVTFYTGWQKLRSKFFFVFVPFVFLFWPIVEEDEDEFLTTTRAEGEHNHNNNGSKEKCESINRCCVVPLI